MRLIMWWVAIAVSSSFDLAPLKPSASIYKTSIHHSVDGQTSLKMFIHLHIRLCRNYF